MPLSRNGAQSLSPHTGSSIVHPCRRQYAADPKSTICLEQRKRCEEIDQKNSQIPATKQAIQKLIIESLPRERFRDIALLRAPKDWPIIALPTPKDTVPLNLPLQICT